MPLRRRLFVLVFIPITLLYLAFGVFGAFQTRADLIAELDVELQQTSQAAAELLAPLDNKAFADLVESSDVGSARLTAIVSLPDGEPLIFPASRNGVAEPAPDQDDLMPKELVNKLGTPFNLESADGTMSYRAMATRIDGGRIFVHAAPLDYIDRLTRTFIAGTLFTSLFLIAAMGAVVYIAIRSGLKPLRNFVDTTTRVAEGDFTERADADQSDPAFAEIARATNHMLDRVEASYEKERFGREHLNDLVANAAHELRTPLTAIRGTVDMRKMGILDSEDKLRTAFNGLDDHSARMESIVEDLIVIARAENLRLEAQGGPASIIDIGYVLSNQVDNISRKYPNRTIKFESRLEGVEVAGDEGLLGTAIEHILENAATHTPHDAKIVVAIDAHGERVRIDIADTGTGIPADLGDRVFDRFVRGDTSRSRETGGAGLGLPIAQSIINSSGGTIVLTSSPKDGAKFSIFLPRFTRGV